MKLQKRGEFERIILPICRTNFIVLMLFLLPCTGYASDDHAIELTVKKGDSLYNICEKILEDPEDWCWVAMVNRMQHPRRIFPGQKLIIPIRLLKGVPVDGVVTFTKGDASIKSDRSQAWQPLRLHDRINQGNCIRRGERMHDDQIVIAAVDEKTLAKLGRWPIPRSYYADLLDSFNQASAVGIDIVFTESTDEDTLLAQAIKRQERVVLPAYIDSQFHISYPVKAFAFAGIGHVHLEQEIYGCVKEVFNTISYQKAWVPDWDWPRFTELRKNTEAQCLLKVKLGKGPLFMSIFLASPRLTR